jgi:hypothetical protein
MRAAKSPTPAKNSGKSGANAKAWTKLNVSPRTGSFNCQTASNRDAHRLVHSTS